MILFTNSFFRNIKNYLISTFISSGQKTVAVHVAGAVKFANDNKPKPFQQNFLLTEHGGFWKVATDVFRYQERA